MKLYTKTGDKGQTAIIGGRVDKDDVRVEAYGTVDELNSFVGQAIAELADDDRFRDVFQDLETIQHELFDCGGDLASVSERRPLKLEEAAIDHLEKRIDVLSEEAPAIERFILPGGSKPAATLHIARTITRRAERLVVRLAKQDETLSAVTLKYLNRLSDYFFALARVVNARLDVRDVEYVRSARVFRSSKKDS
ncbi:cob(I)yrinic acid a,c-diamide adenosyltransferase [Lentibacillus saliphilus]|uniref:cob(I)yrinic acid a,c-diamide adenosyltransferase n=1 Tax=Lentibacillus saliphilus TaxID=2737028 RepID=UPI001C30CA90|nr:cob(I)yrinic acid a,c-diamide adenosyltransferase [Lentibacillus saliphilus]